MRKKRKLISAFQELLNIFERVRIKGIYYQETEMKGSKKLEKIYTYFQNKTVKLPNGNLRWCPATSRFRHQPKNNVTGL